MSDRVDRFVMLLVGILICVVVPLSAPKFWFYTFARIAPFAIVVIGLTLLVGVAGQISFAAPVFMAIGGYSAAILSVKEHWNPWLSMLAGVGLSGVIATIIGYPLLRLRGHYFAMATFALSLGTLGLINGLTRLTGGPVGISNVPPPKIFGSSLANVNVFYGVGWALVGVTVFVFFALRKSRVGRAWLALSAREDIAMGVGIDVRRYKVIAFALSAVAGALGGALIVQSTYFVAPDLYSADTGVLIFVMLFLGGLGSSSGAVIGAIVVTAVPFEFTQLGKGSALTFELVMLAILVIYPQGLIAGVIGTITDKVDFGRFQRRTSLAAAQPETSGG